MINDDTIKLLKECASGVDMGVEAINDVLEYVNSKALKSTLVHSKKEHQAIKNKIVKMLHNYKDEKNSSSIVTKTMSWIKTNMQLILNDSDKTVATIMFKGASMGIRSLSKYLNEYKAAEKKAIDLAKDLIKIEDNLSINMRKYL